MVIALGTEVISRKAPSEKELPQETFLRSKLKV